MAATYYWFSSGGFFRVFSKFQDRNNLWLFDFSRANVDYFWIITSLDSKNKTWQQKDRKRRCWCNGCFNGWDIPGSGAFSWDFSLRLNYFRRSLSKAFSRDCLQVFLFAFDSGNSRGNASRRNAYESRGSQPFGGVFGGWGSRSSRLFRPKALAEYS